MTVRRNLVLTVRLHGDGHGTARFHGVYQGTPEWPPSPARVFQALLAGVARGRALPLAMATALQWLENLPAPTIGAPRRRLGETVALYVPNNNADALADKRDRSSIRTKKLVRPWLFAHDVPFVYAWPSADDGPNAERVVEAANDLYQLGRGVDIAWALAELLDDAAWAERQAAYRGEFRAPGPARPGVPLLACPAAGTLDSLLQRFASPRFHSIADDIHERHLLFTNQPKPRFRSVCYETVQRRVVFELRDKSTGKPWPWPLTRAAALIETLRDAAAEKLRRNLPGHAAAIERVIVGRTPEGSFAVPVAERVRIVPLPSIGFEHADRAIRRLLLELPSASALPAADVEWAFAGLETIDQETGEVSRFVLAPADAGDRMLGHFAGPSRHWRSVTSVALPESARRRRIDLDRQREQAKGAAERLAEEAHATVAVHAALRHAGIHALPLNIQVQREPCEVRGARAESFAEGTRFVKEQLWHVAIEFDRQLEGPLVIGNGRFLGLGVMAPLPDSSDHADHETGTVHASARRAKAGLLVFTVDGQADGHATTLARALRRAVMARVQAGSARPLDRYFSGHGADGSKSDAKGADHLGFHWDPPRRRLLVVAPHRLDRRTPGPGEPRHWAMLERALDGMEELRAGVAGRFGVRMSSLDASDALLAPACRWSSVTPYVVTRHHRCASAAEALADDVLAECRRRGLPTPKVTVVQAQGVSGQGLTGFLRLDFNAAVTGPVALGRTRFLGGGLFEGQSSARQDESVTSIPPTPSPP